MALGVSSDGPIVPYSPCGNKEMTLPMLDGDQIGVDGIGSPCYLAGAAKLEVYRAGIETGVTRPESVSPASCLFPSKGLDLQMHIDAGV